MTTKISTKGRILYCRKCDGHGKLSILKAHNTKCPYLFCECKNCQKLDKKRRNSFQKRNHLQIEAAEKLTKLRQQILHLREDLKDDPDAEALIAEIQKQKIHLPLKYSNVSRDIPNRETTTFYRKNRSQSCDTINCFKMTNKFELKFSNDNVNNINELVLSRATSSSPYSCPTKSYSAGLNSAASSPSSKSSSSAAPFDLWLEKEYQRRQEKKKMEAMRTYTSTAQSTASSPLIISTSASTTNAVATNPLLSHALNTAGIIKNNNKNHQAATTSTTTTLESIINRKRSAGDEIIQIDDDQPTPRRHCSNVNNQCPSDFNKAFTTAITSLTTTVTTPSTVLTPLSFPPPPNYSQTPSSFPPLKNSSTPVALEGHRYVTLPTIPPISVLVPNDIKIMDKFDEIINSTPSNFNPSTLNLNGQTNSTTPEVSAGLIPSTKQISTSASNQLLLEGLRNQKPPHDPQTFKDAFLSQSFTTQSQFNNPISTNQPFQQMIPQNLNNNNNNNNNNIYLDSNQLLNIVPPPQWIQLIQQPQHNPPHFQKSNLLQQQIQAAPTPQNFQQSFQTLQKNQPFLPSLTNQPQLRFSSQPLPPSANAGLSALLSQNNTLNNLKNINLNQQNSSTPSLPINTSVGIQILNQPQQNDSNSASNLSNNNLINFANFTLPTITPPQPPFILQTQFQPPPKQQQPLQQAVQQSHPQQQQQIMTAKQINIQQQQDITSKNLFEQIQQQHQRLTTPKTPSHQTQLPPTSQPIQTPTSQSLSQSHSPALSSITKLNFPIEQQPFAQYLLNLPPISPLGSRTNTTPQLPSLGQSPSDVSTENGNTSSSFTPSMTEHLFTSTTTSSQFDASLSKHSPTDEIAFINEDDTADDKKTMTVGSVVSPTYLDVLQSNMIILSSNGQKMVK